MAEQTDLQKDLAMLSAEIKRLEAEYNMFFAGRLPKPPWETRSRVEAIVKRYDRAHIQNSDRFRSRCHRFQRLRSVDRGLRERERAAGAVREAAAQAPAAGGADPARSCVTALKDPMREMDKVHALYDSLMDARRGLGEDVVPFHRFAALVKDQVSKLRDTGTAEVAFRVAVVDGKVNFTARGMKESGESEE